VNEGIGQTENTLGGPRPEGPTKRERWWGRAGEERVGRRQAWERSRRVRRGKSTEGQCEGFRVKKQTKKGFKPNGKLRGDAISQ